MVVSHYIKLFCTVANSDSGTLMSVLLLVVETINLRLFNYFLIYSETYRYMDYKREVVHKKEVFKLGSFSQKWNYFNTNRK